jgi:hypothetical protein
LLQDQFFSAGAIDRVPLYRWPTSRAFAFSTEQE